MKISDQIEMLELSLSMGDREMVIHPVVIRDQDSYVLVDTGMPGCYEKIVELMSQAGIDPAAPHSIIVTHQDIDHVGSLPQFKGEGVEVHAHAEDQPYIDGLKPMIKFSGDRKKGLLESLPVQLAEAFEATFSGKVTNVTRLLADGEKLPFGGGLTVIYTPGHTPGHISLYHEPSKTLITGDAMVINNGELQGPNPPVTPNMDEAMQSITKFKAYPIENVICYHGGLYQGDGGARIAELTESL